MKKSLSVLIVDDDPTISEIMKEKLTMSGHTVHHILNGAKVIFTGEQVSPDVIILDLMMTNMSGEEVLKELKNNEKLREIPVLVFSNKGIEQEMEDLAELGAAKALVKADTSLSELVDVVEELAKGK